MTPSDTTTPEPETQPETGADTPADTTGGDEAEGDTDKAED